MLVSTEGSLVHAFRRGALGTSRFPRGQSPPRSGDRTSQGGPGPPRQHRPRRTGASLRRHRGRNSILSTANRDVPLFRLDGRDQGDDFIDKIRWDGRKVAYDRIKTYRRDEVLHTGVSPKIYDRANWTTAFLPKDESPMLGDVKFLRETDPSQAAWKLDRDDFQARTRKPDRRQRPRSEPIPRPPAEGDL